VAVTLCNAHSTCSYGAAVWPIWIRKRNIQTKATIETIPRPWNRRGSFVTCTHDASDDKIADAGPTTLGAGGMSSSQAARNEALANGALPQLTLEFYRHAEEWSDAHSRGALHLQRFCDAATAVHGAPCQPAPPAPPPWQPPQPRTCPSRNGLGRAAHRRRSAGAPGGSAAPACAGLAGACGLPGAGRRPGEQPLRRGQGRSGGPQSSHGAARVVLPQDAAASWRTVESSHAGLREVMAARARRRCGYRTPPLVKLLGSWLGRARAARRPDTRWCAGGGSRGERTGHGDHGTARACRATGTASQGGWLGWRNGARRGRDTAGARADPVLHAHCVVHALAT